MCYKSYNIILIALTMMMSEKCFYLIVPNFLNVLLSIFKTFPKF
ncbi:histidine kinase [Leptospira interrogans serovar Canicola]|nr:histidine kinase [Leptospira interrogans serovar Canicola]